METSASPRAPTTRHAADDYAAIAAWRPPEARRFDPAPANDWRAEVEQAVREPEPDAGDWTKGDPLPGWVTPVAGAVLAAVIGAGVGSWLQVY